MRSWVWRQVRVELPEDWEMLQLSRDPRAGRCAWADRYQFRLEMLWRQTESVPDVGRLASDYLAREQAETARPEPRPPTELRSPAEGAAEARRSSIGLWQGIEGRQGGVWTSRFARHLSEASCLVELVLLWPNGKADSLQQAIVESVADEPRRADGLERWRAFGMDLLATRGLALAACRVTPGWARMEFSGASPQRRETFERLGMLSDWLEGSVRDWLRRQSQDGVAADTASSIEVNGHAVETLSGRWRRSRLAGLLGRLPAVEAAAWVCPTDGRLYHVSTVGPEPSAGVPLPGGRLVCCDRMRSNPQFVIRN